jgi:hypothetical protein
VAGTSEGVKPVMLKIPMYKGFSIVVETKSVGLALNTKEAIMSQLY